MPSAKVLEAGSLPDLLFEDPYAGRCLVAPDGTVLRANRAWLRSNGLGLDVIGADVVQLLPLLADTREAALAMLARARAGERVEVPRHARRVGRREAFWDGAIDPVPMDGGTALLITQREAPRDSDRQQDADRGLRASEVRFRTLAEESPVVLWSRDARGDVEFVNRAFREFYGLTFEEVEGTEWRPPVHPEDAARFEGGVQTAVWDRKPFSEEARVRRVDGEWRWIAARGRPRFGEAGEYLGHVGISVDITDRKRAEVELRESEERFRLALRSAPVTVAAQDRDLKYIWAYNQKTVPGGLVGLRDEQVFTPEEAARITALKRRVLEEGVTIREKMWLDRAGRRVFLEACAEPLRDATGRVVGVTTATIDVTERELAEESLRASEERLRMAQHLARVGSFEWEIQGGDATWTTELAALHGRSGEEFMEDAASLRLVHPEDRAEVGRRLQLALETGQLAEGEYRVVWPDGTVRWLASRWQVVKDDSGAPLRMTGVNMDVTDRKRAEELRVSEAVLRERDSENVRFLAVLSHELRNPLAPIRNGLYILERAAPGSEKARRAQAIIGRQIGHLTLLIEDLLDVTRMSHGKTQLQRERFDLNELAHRAVDDHRSVFARSGIQLEAVAAPAEVWIFGDRLRLAQVLGNLLQNAAKFTPRGGQVTVLVESNPARGQALLGVRDTGIGIEPEMLPRLFQPFAQADTTLDRSKGGLGLGLSLVKGLVELHGGSVTAVSGGPGKGSTFTVSLPVDVAVARDGPRQGGGQSDGVPRRVLVIDDNEDAANSLREVLELDEHVVEVAFTGREGLERAHAFHPDVVLCDIGLPEMDGYEVARAMRADSELRRIALVAVTGYAQPEDVQAAREAGFEAHLTKPPSLEALERTLAEVGRP